MAPTCAELEKRISGIERRLSAVDRIESKLSTLDDISEKLESLKTLQDIVTSMHFLNEKFDEMKKDIELLKKENHNLKVENGELWKENTHLENKLEELDTYNRRNNIIIRNVPFGQGEDTDAIVQKIADKLEVSISKNDIEASHRLPSKKGIKPLVVRFVNRRLKEKMMIQVKKTSLTNKDLGFAGEIQKIYLAEHLTPKRQEIFNAALAAKREQGFKYLWTRNGSIFIRRSDGSPAFRISSLQDLRNICMSN